MYLHIENILPLNQIQNILIVIISKWYRAIKSFFLFFSSEKVFSWLMDVCLSTFPFPVSLKVVYKVSDSSILRNGQKLDNEEEEVMVRAV